MKPVYLKNGEENLRPLKEKLMDVLNDAHKDLRDLFKIAGDKDRFKYLVT